MTTLTAVESETRFWDNAFSVPLEKLEASPETKEILTEHLAEEGGCESPVKGVLFS